jgi:hypothetical protein
MPTPAAILAAPISISRRVCICLSALMSWHLSR